MAVEEVSLLVKIGALQSNFAGTMQQYTSALEGLIQVFAPDDVSFIRVGATPPTQNEGPFLNTSFDPPQWQVFSNNASQYVDLAISDKTRRITLAIAEPDPLCFDIWVEVNASNEIQNIYTHNGTNWVTNLITQSVFDNLQDEVDRIELGVGLNPDGTWGPIAGTNFFDGSTSVFIALTLLDIQIEANKVCCDDNTADILDLKVKVDDLIANPPGIVHEAPTTLVTQSNTPVGFTTFAFGTPPAGKKSIYLNTLLRAGGDDGVYQLFIKDTNGRVYRANEADAFTNVSTASRDTNIVTNFFDITGSGPMQFSVVKVSSTGTDEYDAKIDRWGWL